MRRCALFIIVLLVIAACKSKQDVSATPPGPTAPPEVVEISGVSAQRVLGRDIPNARGVAWSPDGTRIAVYTVGGEVRLFDGTTYQRAKTLPDLLELEVSSHNIAWSPDSRYIAMGTEGGDVAIRDVETGLFPLTLRRDGGFVMSVAWSPNGQRIAASSDGKPVEVWDIRSGTSPENFYNLSGLSSDLAFTPDSSYVIALPFLSTEINRFNLIEGARGNSIPLDQVGRSMSLSPDGGRVAVSYGYPDQPDTSGLALFDTVTGNPVKILPDARGAAQELRWSPAGGLILAIYAQQKQVWLYDTDLKAVAQLEGIDASVLDAAWSPDGTRLVLLEERGRALRVVDLRLLPEVADRLPQVAENTPVPHPIVPITMQPPTPTAPPPPAPTLIPSIPSAFQGILPLGAVGRLGQGSLDVVEVSPDGTRLAVGGSVGITAYDSLTFEVAWYARTDDRVMVAAWSPDSKMLAAGLANGDVLIWDGPRGMPLYTITVHDTLITGLHWSPDSERLISTERGGVGAISDLTTADPPIPLIRTDVASGPYGFYGMDGALSPNGRLFASIYWMGGPAAFRPDQAILVWDAVNGALLPTYRVTDQVSDVVWRTDDTLLAIGDTGRLHALNIQSNALTSHYIREDELPYWNPQLSLSPDGGYVAVQRGGSPIQIFDLNEGKVINTLPEGFADLYWYGNSHISVLDQNANMLRFLDMATLEEASAVENVTGIADVTYGGLQVLAWSGPRAETLEAIWWDPDGVQRRAIATQTSKITSVAWLRGETQIATISIDWDMPNNNVVIWDVLSDGIQQVFTYPGPAQAQVGWSSGVFVVNEEDYTASLWDTISSTQRGTLDYFVNAAAASPDSKYLLVGGSEGDVQIFDVQDGWVAATYDGIRGRGVTAVAWSPDGQRIAAAFDEGSIGWWLAGGIGKRLELGPLTEAESGEVLIVRSLAFSPDGKFLAAAASTHSGQGEITVWDVEQGQPYFRLRVPYDAPTSVAWSPDGFTLAAGIGNPELVWQGSAFPMGAPKPVVLWNAQTGERIKVLWGAHQRCAVGGFFAGQHAAGVGVAGWDGADLGFAGGASLTSPPTPSPTRAYTAA